MVVCPTRDDCESAFDELVGKNPGILLDLLSPSLELWLERLSEGDCLGGDDMLERTSLLTWENC